LERKKKGQSIALQGLVVVILLADKTQWHNKHLKNPAIGEQVSIIDGSFVDAFVIVVFATYFVYGTRSD